MLSHIEELLLKSLNEINDGWNTININNEVFRIIRLGNVANCNGELIKDKTTFSKIKRILETNKINTHTIKRIETEMENSVELILNEYEYCKLINQIKMNVKKEL